jgi:acetylglutamate kinase
MKTAILKISGKALNDIFNTELWINEIKKIKEAFGGLIIVHGAGQSISEWSEALGLEAKFINGQRVTTEKVMDVVAAVQSGILNSKIVSRMTTCGIDAVGLSGIDRGTFIAENVNFNLGNVGIPVVKGNVDWIKTLVKEGVVPIFSSVCRNETGSLMNVNADIFTEVLAAALKADSVFFVSDVTGVKLFGAVQKLVDEQQIINGIAAKEITDGMIPKLSSCLQLLNNGINKIWIGKNPEIELDEEIKINGGTWIVKSA